MSDQKKDFQIDKKELVIRGKKMIVVFLQGNHKFKKKFRKYYYPKWKFNKKWDYFINKENKPRKKQKLLSGVI